MAAMKHVNYVEISPGIAIQVNILHTINLCKLSFKNGLKNSILYQPIKP